MGIGLFLEKEFKNKEVELLTDHPVEWMIYAESTKVNSMIVHCIFKEYDAVSGVLVLQSVSSNDTFYIDEEFVHMFWKPGFKCLENLKALWSGQKLYKDGKNKDIM